MDQTAIRDAIAQISKLPNEDLALLLSCAVCRHLKKGELLLKEGEVCHHFYQVEKGYLRTYYNKDGVVINLNFTFEGEFASNPQSIKSKKPSEWAIEAGEDATIWIVDLHKLTAYTNIHPQISNFVRRLAIRLLLVSEEHSNLFKIHTATERYHFIEKNNPRLLQRISLSQIASYLGVTRETLSRIRAKTH